MCEGHERVRKKGNRYEGHKREQEKTVKGKEV